MAARLFDVPAAVVLSARLRRLAACRARWTTAARSATPPPGSSPRCCATRTCSKRCATSSSSFPTCMTARTRAWPGSDRRPLRRRSARPAFLRRCVFAANRPPPTGPKATRCLCLLDSRPRQLRAEDRRLLDELTSLADDTAAPPTPSAPISPTPQARRTTILPRLAPVGQSLTAAPIRLTTHASQRPAHR